MVSSRTLSTVPMSTVEENRRLLWQLGGTDPTAHQCLWVPVGAPEAWVGGPAVRNRPSWGEVTWVGG